jgi:hypothetical protein
MIWLNYITDISGRCPITLCTLNDLEKEEVSSERKIKIKIGSDKAEN